MKLDLEKNYFCALSVENSHVFVFFLLKVFASGPSTFNRMTFQSSTFIYNHPVCVKPDYFDVVNHFMDRPVDGVHFHNEHKDVRQKNDYF